MMTIEQGHGAQHWTGTSTAFMAYAPHAVSAAQRTRSGYVIKKLARLQVQMTPLLHDHAVRELNEQITHLLTTQSTAEEQEHQR